MSNIFVSYSRKSRSIADSLATDLTELGESVWLDEELSGGQSWWNEILSEVRRCDLFVFVLDPDSLNSAACKSEYEYAAGLGKPILPVLVSEKVSTGLLPPALSQIQFVDYRTQERKAVLQLARAISLVPPAPALPNPLPTPPEVPLSYLGKLTPQVETDAALTLQEQTNLVFQLKRGLNDPGMEQDTRTLLERVRRRQDLYATVAEEIDVLLRSTASLGTDPDALKTTKLHSDEPAKRETGPSGTGGHQHQPPVTSNIPSGNVGRPGPPPGYSTGPPPQQNAPPPQIPNYLVFAILSVFCCWPVAIGSIIYASQVNQKVAAGDYAGAMESSKKARLFAIIAAIAGVIVFVIWFLIGFLNAASQGSNF
jgi:TIR domain-containing protein/interferon-induced transmembrane protein